MSQPRSCLRRFGGLHGFYIAFVMARLESVMSVIVGLYALISPMSFLASVAQGFDADELGLKEGQGVTLIAGIASGGMILAGLLKCLLLAPPTVYGLDWPLDLGYRIAQLIFILIEVIIKGLYLSSLVHYLMVSSIVISEWQISTWLNLGLATSQFLAILIAVGIEYRWPRYTDRGYIKYN